MSAQILYGKPCADKILDDVREATREKRATLYAVGFDNPQWNQYLHTLRNSGEKCGINVCSNTLDENTSVFTLCDVLQRVCGLQDADGLILQQPLPIQYMPAVKFVDVSLDVDCVNPESVLNLYRGTSGFRPATPSAVLRLLDFYGEKIAGKHVVIVGRGSVGKPLALMMLARDATVTVCHSKTLNLPEICKTADILVSACGMPGLINQNFVNENALVVDVGLSFVNGKSHGDVCPDVCEKCRALAPAPGGVGPVTRAVLFENLVSKNKSCNDN